MRAIIGYGNELRGEDAFGIDVIKELQKFEIKDTRLISAFGLTPEVVLELLDTDEVIFVDAAFSKEGDYALACSINKESTHLSHSILPHTIISILENVYKKHPTYQIYSMLTNSFENIDDAKKYRENIAKVASFLC
ncbi:hypothetical protein [Sulfurimonas sp. HSL-1716]|uniref:hypothetical protein n=1 Tax=Hydrocurvibacter sulfurireducens TaxID=3131937 RepID=UPI0031F8056E